MSNKGLFVISLDFELYWGMIDKVSLDAYGENLKGVHTAIPKLLSVFTEYGIHATWATVGMLMFDTKTELISALPSADKQPRYRDMRASSYEHIANDHIGESVETDPYHYGAALVQKIIDTPHQELASHTFSHYYCLDGSKNGEAIFAADCACFKHAAKRFNREVASIVFPRNQTTTEALKTCKEFGITAYRGTPRHFLYSAKKEKEQTNPFLRILRLIDTYINISGNHTYTFTQTKEDELVNVIGSKFFRPYSNALRAFESLRIARIKKGMTYAAQRGEIFHLWWHPHNFGVHQEENFRNLTAILEHFAYLQKKYGMESASMQEVATRAIG